MVGATAVVGASLLLGLWSGGNWDGRLQAAAEIRGGEAPLSADTSPRAGGAALLTPAALLRWLSSDVKLELSYSTRFFYRHPNEIGQDRVLILHTGRFLVGAALGPAWQLTGVAQTSVGQADYSSLPGVLGVAPGTLPAVLDIFVINAGLGLMGDPSRRWHLELAVDAERRDTLGEASPAAAAGNMYPLPRQSMIQTRDSLGMRPTRTDLVGVGVVAGYAKYDTFPVLGVSLFTVAPNVFWRMDLSRQTDLRLSAGFAVSRRWGEPLSVVAMQAPLIVSPTFEVLAKSHVAHFDGQIFDLAAGLRGEPFLDPVLAVVTPRAVLTIQALWRSPPHWETGLEGFVLTSMRSEPLPMNPDETAFYVTLPVRYRVSPHWTWEWGARWGDRAPHWAASNFAFHQRQIWFYVSLMAETGNLFE